MIKRCRKCVLPDTYPGISFDNEGVCNICKDYIPIRYKGQRALEKILKENKGDGQWDCLVPLSGGRDSSYTLYKLVREYKQKVLVYNYDNGFVESVARENIQKIADRLGVEVVYRKSVRNIQCRYVAEITKMNVNKSPGHVLAFLCSGCRNGIWGGAYKVAKEHGISLIIFGESAMESGGFKERLMPQFMPSKREKIEFLVRKPANFFKRKHLEHLLNKEFPLQEESGIKKINFFDYEEWDQDKILSTIKGHLGWQQKDALSSWRFDCQIHALVNAMTYQLIGMTEKEELLSRQIREGKITRDLAIQYINRKSDGREIELAIAQNVLDKMGISVTEKQKIIDFCAGEPKLKNEWS